MRAAQPAYDRPHHYFLNRHLILSISFSLSLLFETDPITMTISMVVDSVRGGKSGPFPGLFFLGNSFPLPRLFAQK